MRALVTGSAGFIGSHLTLRLLTEGHEVVGVDCLTDYYDPGLKKHRLSEIRALFPSFVQRDIDITLDKNLDSLREHSFDVIIHLAAQPGVRLTPPDYGLYYSRNLIGTANILQFATLNDIQRVVFASSSSIYGNSCSLPLKEGDAKMNPVSAYGSTKLAAEVLARGSSAADGLTTRGLRFFTVYGSMGRPDMAYFRLIASALGQWEFTLTGAGDVRRDFTHVSDTVESIRLLTEELFTRPTGFHDVVNVGGGNTRSILDLITSVERITGAEIHHGRVAPDGRDVAVTEADFTYLQQLVSAKPSIQLEEGLVEVFEWAKRPEVLASLRRWIESVSR